ncbi:MAG TPA: hypothetical protein VHZ26_13585 [Caulobacteraceae bacterium]|jgi:hypothetical protein|nr:hypothetical protein [Caulobacteraceae bacterium]
MVSVSRHAGRWGAYAALGIVALLGLLYPPAPSLAQAQRPHEKPAESHQSSAGGDAQQPPAAVQLIQVYGAPQDQTGAEQNEKGNGKESAADWWMVKLTFAIAVFAGFQVLIFLAQLFTTYSQLRAYVFIEDAEISAIDGKNATPPFNGATWIAHYTVKNAGSTPAHKVKVFDSLTVEDWFPEKLPIPTAEDALGSMAPSGDFIEAEADELVLPPQENGAVTDKTDPKRAIFLVGKIFYRDVFYRTHRTDFCFFWKGPIGDKADQMSAYDEGNDST